MLWECWGGRGTSNSPVVAGGAILGKASGWMPFSKDEEGWFVEEKGRYCRKKTNLGQGRESWAGTALVRMEQRVYVKINQRRRLGKWRGLPQ